MIWTCKGVRSALNCHLYTTRRSCSKSRTVASGLYIKHLCPVWWCVLFVSYWQLWILWLHIELELLNTEHGQHWIQVREADQERRHLILRDFLYCVPWKAWLQPFLSFCSCSIRTHQVVLSEGWLKKFRIRILKAWTILFTNGLRWNCMLYLIGSLLLIIIIIVCWLYEVLALPRPLIISPVAIEA